MAELNPESKPGLSQAGPGARWLLLSLVVLTVVALAPGNSESRRLRHHEILVAQTATEMLQSGDYLVPHVMGEKRLQKPPMSYWLSAAAHAVIGEAGSTRVSGLEVRLPSLLAGLLLLLVTCRLGTLVTRDARGGLLAGAVLAGSWMFFTHARSGRPEMLYALFCALVLLGFLIALRRAEQGLPNRGAAALGWGAFGLSLFAKGPQFPVFMLLGVLVVLLLRKPRPKLSAIFHPWMALPALALPAAYFAFLLLQVDDVAGMWGEQMVQGDKTPLLLRPLRFYYPLALLQGMAPWVVLFGAMLVAAWKRRTPDILVMAGSVLLPLLLVSFAGKLRSHYLLPLIPACAVLIGWTLLGLFDRLRDSASGARRQWALLWSQYALTGLMVVALIAVFAGQKEQPFGDLLDAGAIALLSLTSLAFVVSALAARRSAGAMFATLAVTVLLSYGAFSWMNLDEADSAATSYEFVQAVEQYLPGDAELYIDPSIRLLPYYYHSSKQLQKLTPVQWRDSANEGPAPYFVTLNRDVERDGIPGEILIEQTGVPREVAMVLFRPAPLPR